MITSSNFKDYTLLAAGDKEKLESWNGVILRRPDPMAIWPKDDPELFETYDGYYHRSSKGGGNWEFRRRLKDYWTVAFDDLIFKVSPTNFKHTGLFPEQAANWEFVKKKIKGKKEIKVLNLFAYTGAATMACAKAGALEVVHVDAAKGMVEWAKENMYLNHLEDHKIRFIVDDCLKFIKRENRRGHKYDGIIMDPPSYGRGPGGELFRFEDQINELLKEAVKLLSDRPLFIIVNSYTTGYSATVLNNVMNHHLKDYLKKGYIESDELGIKVKDKELYLPCGLTTRWVSYD